MIQPKFPFLSLLILLIFIMACQSEHSPSDKPEQAAPTDLQEELIGTWQTVQLNVAVNSADGLDSFRAEQLTELVWERQFRMEPPIYYFRPDQKYRRVHRDLDGRIVDESQGSWETSGDTLILTEPGQTYRYVVKAGDGRATFRTLMDWDEDGAEDDVFQSLQRRISISAD
ncbi:MAG: hypothetical protein D6772_09175 [Bacteroidetes bacterium]|nr:MAG: hypothetical protein D6772_09175 [Bacteroidota bacterium]